MAPVISYPLVLPPARPAKGWAANPTGAPYAASQTAISVIRSLSDPTVAGSLCAAGTRTPVYAVSALQQRRSGDNPDRALDALGNSLRVAAVVTPSRYMLARAGTAGTEIVTSSDHKLTRAWDSGFSFHPLAVAMPSCRMKLSRFPLLMVTTLRYMLTFVKSFFVPISSWYNQRRPRLPDLRTRSRRLFENPLLRGFGLPFGMERPFNTRPRWAPCA